MEVHAALFRPQLPPFVHLGQTGIGQTTFAPELHDLVVSGKALRN
jgi:hypothetical protein